MLRKVTTPIFVFLGPPGSGKGSQAKKLSSALQLPHISTGDLIRHYVHQEGPLSQTLRDLLDKGELVPDSTILELLNDRVQKQDCALGFILDGFPRNLAQAKILDDFVEEKELLIFINIILDHEIICRRLTGRRTCMECSKIYHIDYAPPFKEEVCDDCEEPLKTRRDDEESVILNRLALFDREFAPMKAYYRDRPYWIDLVSDRALDTCFSELFEQLMKKAPHLTLTP